MNKHSAERTIKVLMMVVSLFSITLTCGIPSKDINLPAETQPMQTTDAVDMEIPTQTARVIETQAAPTPKADGGEPTKTTNGSNCILVDFNGISFCFDPSIAREVTTEVIQEMDSPEDRWLNSPETEQIVFSDYASVGMFDSPRILVYPIDDYKRLDEYSAEVIDALEQLITNQADLPAGALPFLPLWPAGQLFHTQAAFLEFQNGQGIRYLTEYGQDSAPLNNEDLFYTFQGITNDGKYYVSAILPVDHPSLPAKYSFDPVLSQQLFEDYAGYLDENLPALSAQPPDSFTPSISLLDAMIRSMQIH